MNEEIENLGSTTPIVDADSALSAEVVELAAIRVSPVDLLVTETIGKRLRAAREAAGLSVDTVAQTLKYSPRQIELIEADNYAALPGATVVRGFARSYAKLLKLDAVALLQLLDERTPVQQADVRPPENMGAADDVNAPRQFSLMASAAIVLTLVALILAVWHFLGDSSPATLFSDGAKEHVAAAPAETPPVVVAPSAPSATANEPTPSVAAPLTAVPVAPASDASVASSPTLKFVFSGRSWLEVTDAQKQLLRSGENFAGSELNLTGKPPFDVVVGNAAKVKLTYGDREIDLTPYTRAEVARLKVE